MPRAYVVLAVVTAVIISVLPPGGAVPSLLHLGLHLSVLVTLVVGLRVRRPERPRAWYVLLAGMALYFVASVVRYPTVTGPASTRPFPSFADDLHLLSYGVMLLGLVLLVRCRTRGGYTNLLDTLILATGIGLISTTFLIDPYVHAGAPIRGTLVSLAFPVMDLLLVGAVARLLLESGRREPALWLLSLSVLSQLAGDWIHGYRLVHGVFASGDPAAEVFWLVSLASFGAAVLHPSMRTLTEPSDHAGSASRRSRLSMLGAVALTGPVIVLVQRIRGKPIGVPLFSTISATLLVLVIVRLSLALRDIERYEGRLRMAEAMYRSLVETTPAVTYLDVSDPSSEVGYTPRYMSPQVSGLLGHAGESFVEHIELFASLIHPDDRERVLEAEARHYETGDPLVEEYRMIARDGRTVWVLDRALIVERQGESAQCSQGVLFDVTASKHAEDAIKAKEIAERSDHAKSEFLSRMSHELRTPLNAILGFGQLLEMASLAPQDQESVAQILGGGRHLLELVDEVLDISRIDARQLPLSLEPVLVADAFRDASALVRTLAVERGIELRAEVADPSVHVLADRHRLTQVLLNLLSNGVKYTSEGGKIDVSCTGPTERMVTIRVCDTGHGIAPDRMDRLFSAFDRLGVETLDNEGTGLGLTVSKGLVEAMGGTIEAVSAFGEGTTFSVRLPVAEGRGIPD